LAGKSGKTFLRNPLEFRRLVPLYGWKEMPAAGDFNPTRFIAKFQRNSPLPPFYSLSALTALP
jgi:hypothetical protein